MCQIRKIRQSHSPEKDVLGRMGSILDKGVREPFWQGGI